MKTTHKKRKMTCTANRRVNPLRIDPTRTISLRRAHAAELKRAFAKIKNAVRKLVVMEDAFGIVKRMAVTNAFDPDQPRGDDGRWGSGAGRQTVDAIKAAGASAQAVEHAVKEKLVDNIAKLPTPVQDALYGSITAAFTGWTASQSLAESVAKARGMTDEQAKALRGALVAADLMLFKPASVALAMTGAGSILTAASWVVPPASGAYLAYSTARNPIKTAKAAWGAVKDAVGRIKSKLHGEGGFVTSNTSHLDADLLADSLAAHGFDDRHFALLCSAMDQADSVADTVELAEECYRVENVFCKTGEGGGIDPSCSHTSGKELDETTDWIYRWTSGGAVAGGGFFGDKPTDEVIKNLSTARPKEPVLLYRSHSIGSKHGDYESWTTSANVADAITQDSENKRVTLVRRVDPSEILMHGGMVKSEASDYVLDNEVVVVGGKEAKRIAALRGETLQRGDTGLGSPMLPAYRQRLIDQGVIDNALTINPFVSEAQRRACWAKDDPDWDCEEWEEATENVRFAFHSDPDKIVAFQQWLKGQVAAYLTGKTQEELWQRYAEAGYKKGAGRAFDDTRASVRTAMTTGQGEVSDFYHGTKDEFLRSAFAQPVAVEKIKLLAGRSFDDLENVTSDMSARMSRSLTDGLVQGKSPREIAKDMTEDVDLSESRALTIARTEIIRVHAEGQLDAMEKLGVEEVGVAVEWSTSGMGTTALGNPSPCPKCAPKEGVVLTLEEAHGLIPWHPG